MKKAFLSMIRFYQKKKFRLCFRHAAVFILPAPSMPWRQLSVLAHVRAVHWPCGGFCGVIRFFRVDMILCLLKINIFPHKINKNHINFKIDIMPFICCGMIFSN